jgi:hypothetical protein
LVYIFYSSIFWDTRRWIKSKSTIRSIPTHHRQNPTEIKTTLLCPCRDSNPGHSVLSMVIVLTELSGMLQSYKVRHKFGTSQHMQQACQVPCSALQNYVCIWFVSSALCSFISWGCWQQNCTPQKRKELSWRQAAPWSQGFDPVGITDFRLHASVNRCA